MRKDLERILRAQNKTVFIAKRTCSIAEEDSIPIFVEKLEVGGVGSADISPYHEMYWEILYYADLIGKDFPRDFQHKYLPSTKIQGLPFSRYYYICTGRL